ncbi:hypothetical protein BC332_34945 [Capsicum chinense]|nr:hypothetical protein BC332_34945 [Capsicum chinense]
MLAIQGRVENVDTGLSREAILARMRCFKYQLTEGSTSDKDTCSIFLDDFSDEQNIGSTDLPTLLALRLHQPVANAEELLPPVQKDCIGNLRGIYYYNLYIILLTLHAMLSTYFS